MTGTADGGVRAAAARVGLGYNEYMDRLNAGLSYCWACADWHPCSEFGSDKSRVYGIASICRKAKNKRARESYQRRTRPRQRRFVPARDGDVRQARRRVNYLVEIGALPRPNDLACVDCGHLGADKRHEYDHHKGYGPENHENVEPVCTTCHHSRERKRADG